VASRAAALAASGRSDEAVAGLEEHLRQRRDVAVASMLAELRGLRGEPTTDLDRMIDEVLAGEAAAGYDNVLERADIALGRGDVEAARPLAEAAFAARPDNVFAAEVLAAVRFADGDAGGALPLVALATRLDSADLHQHLRAADIHLAAGDTGGARRQLERAFTMAPYPAPGLVAGARVLAERLGIEPPPTWSALR
jgi:predicted Zn-dependent protease